MFDKFPEIETLEPINIEEIRNLLASIQQNLNDARFMLQELMAKLSEEKDNDKGN